MSWKRPDMQASLERGKTLTGGVPLFKPEAGSGGKWKENWIRILPPREDLPADPDTGKTLFYYPVAVHFVGKDRPPVICLRKMFDESCPACAQVREQGDGKGPRWLAAMNVVVLNEDGGPAENLVRLWPCPAGGSTSVFNDLQQAIEELPEDSRDITDPENGRPVLIRRKGTTQKDTRYQVLLSPDPIPFEAPDLLENMQDLVASYEVVTPGRMIELLTGPADPFGAAAAPAARPRLGAGLPPPPDGVVEGESRELAPGEEEEEEEEEAPAPTAVKTKPKAAPTAEEEGARTSLREKLRRAQKETAATE